MVPFDAGTVDYDRKSVSQQRLFVSSFDDRRRELDRTSDDWLTVH